LHIQAITTVRDSAPIGMLEFWNNGIMGWAAGIMVRWPNASIPRIKK
jgi:hypothetical protein